MQQYVINNIETSHMILELLLRPCQWAPSVSPAWEHHYAGLCMLSCWTHVSSQLVADLTVKLLGRNLCPASKESGVGKSTPWVNYAWRWRHCPFLTCRVFFGDFCLNGWQLGSPTRGWRTVLLNVERAAHVGIKNATFVSLAPCSNKTSRLAVILKKIITLLWYQNSLVNLIRPVKKG